METRKLWSMHSIDAALSEATVQMFWFIANVDIMENETSKF